MWEIWSSKPIANRNILEAISIASATELFRYESVENEIDLLRELFCDDGSFLIKKVGHRPKALLFDMDSTLIHEETIVELARAAGRSKEVEIITERAMAGELNFDEALKERVLTLKGLSSQILDDTRTKLTIYQGLPELIDASQKLGINCHVVSGGFEEIAYPLLMPLGFFSVRANRLEKQNGHLTGKVEGAIFNGESKKQRLFEISKEHQIATCDIATIGDGANDIPMMQAGGFALGFHPKPIVVKQSTGINRTGDHRFWIHTLLN